MFEISRVDCVIFIFSYKTGVNPLELSQICRSVLCSSGAQVAQWVKRWLSDLAVEVPGPLQAKSCQPLRGSIAHSL